MRKLMLALAALALSACAGFGSLPVAPPTPLAHTAIDEQAINIALKTADLVATLVDLAVASKGLTPGSPKALTVKTGLIALRDGLKAASAAQRAGNATTYREALKQASAAVDAVKSALGR